MLHLGLAVLRLNQDMSRLERRQQGQSLYTRLGVRDSLEEMKCIRTNMILTHMKKPSDGAHWSQPLLPSSSVSESGCSNALSRPRASARWPGP
jgi:hypothetical protein